MKSLKQRKGRINAHEERKSYIRKEKNCRRKK